MAETREDLPYPVLAVEGGGGDQGASAKPSGYSPEAKPFGLGTSPEYPSRGPAGQFEPFCGGDLSSDRMIAELRGIGVLAMGVFWHD